MIRREISLPDQPPQWLLISQIEHARLCGLLATHCLPSCNKAFREQLIAAIIHHDDGWAAWEALPQLDAKEGRPYSFRELPLADSLEIWQRSILAAAEFGPYAGWVVAEHFLALLEKGESASDPVATSWREKIHALRDKWSEVWASHEPWSTEPELAAQGLAWLQLLDMKSLWLCAVCPGRGETALENRESYLFCAKDGSLECWCHYRNQRVNFEPWRFDATALEFNADGLLVPIDRYATAQQLLAAAVSCTVTWDLSA